MTDPIDIKTIVSIPVFSTAPIDALEMIRLTASVQSLDVGQTLFDEGEASREVYFILEGKVRIYCYSHGDRDVALVDFETGGCFGELAALDGLPRTGRAEALEPTRLMKLDAIVFNELVQKNKEIANQVILRLVGIIRQVDARVADIAVLSDNVRLCRELLRMAQPTSEISSVMYIPLLPKHEILAKQASISVQMVAETMVWLKSEGIIARRPEAPRSIVIKDLERLRAAAHVGNT
ncbi:MAG: Crp/Fnr family transcriptional regulator [Rhodospirillales bacterium]|nr:Crp/Fnr family transcriptional regulator [Rhodospirillales bacterium]